MQARKKLIQERKGGLSETRRQNLFYRPRSLAGSASSASLKTSGGTRADFWDLKAAAERKEKERLLNGGFEQFF